MRIIVRQISKNLMVMLKQLWAGTAALMSAFTSSTPYSLKILGSVANATILQESETKYNTNKVFGDDSKD